MRLRQGVEGSERSCGDTGFTVPRATRARRPVRAWLPRSLMHHWLVTVDNRLILHPSQYLQRSQHVECFDIDPADLLKIIQASIAPVVLISGVGLLLLTLSARLGRIVDRTRIVASDRRRAVDADRAMLNTQLEVLRSRARLIRFALALSATSVALVSLLIIGLFLGLLLDLNMTVPCTILFIGSLLSLVTAMLVFVRELFEALTALDLSIDARN